MSDVNRELLPSPGDWALRGTHFSVNTMLSSGHSIGCQIALAAGPERFLDNLDSPSVLEALATVAGGEEITSAGW